MIKKIFPFAAILLSFPAFTQDLSHHYLEAQNKARQLLQRRSHASEPQINYGYDATFYFCASQNPAAFFPPQPHASLV